MVMDQIDKTEIMLIILATKILKLLLIMSLVLQIGALNRIIAVENQIQREIMQTGIIEEIDQILEMIHFQN